MIYELSPGDCPSAPWLFYDDSSEKLRVRTEYTAYQCSECGKVDELRALAQQGVVNDFQPNSTWDWIGTIDDWSCITTRVREVFESANVEGISFLPVPASDNHWVIVPNYFAATDEEEAGFENTGKACSKCGRYPEKLVGPMLCGVSIPQDENIVFASEIGNENVKVRYFSLFCSQKIANLIRKSGIVGLDLEEPL